MRAFIALLAVLALTFAAHAQGMHGGKRHHNSDQASTKTPRADDKAYKRALSSLPDQKYDPWAGVR